MPVCTHGRKKDVAMRTLEESLIRLQTDHLDVWQVHEVVYYDDPEKCYAPDGVLEALAAAKQQGKVRFVGFTGHKNPSVQLAMLNGGFPFDTIQMPLNPFDYSYRSFQQEVLPVAAQRGLAVFGMKSMGGSGEMISMGALTRNRGAYLCHESARRLLHDQRLRLYESAQSESGDSTQLQATFRKADHRVALLR